MTDVLTAPNVESTPPPVETGQEHAWRVTKRLLRVLLGGLISLMVAMFVWWLLVKLVDKPRQTRTPDQVFRYLFGSPTAAANRQEMIESGKITLRDAALGFFAGTIAAVILSCVFVLKRGVEQATMPLAMALRTVPLVALTPLIALIFGRDLLGVTVIAGIVTFFPTLVNVTLALRSVPPEQLDLLHAYGANDRLTLRKVQFPSALPALFASARIAAPLALIGAMLAEWLATGKGMGYLILQSGATFKIDRLWAATFLVTLASVVLYTIISAVETVVLARYAPGKSRRVL
jgi:ABC-type nitrate/sulfonate/bicarbonate transport system permease component